MGSTTFIIREYRMAENLSEILQAKRDPEVEHQEREDGQNNPNGIIDSILMIPALKLVSCR